MATQTLNLVNKVHPEDIQQINMLSMEIVRDVTQFTRFYRNGPLVEPDIVLQMRHNDDNDLLKHPLGFHFSWLKKNIPPNIFKKLEVHLALEELKGPRT